jgi:hypothetical protein
MCDKWLKPFPTYRLPDKTTGREEGEGGEEEGKRRGRGGRILSPQAIGF